MAANEDMRVERQRAPDPYDEPEEEYLDEDELPPRRSGRVLPIVVASLAIFGFVVIVYYAYQQGIRAGTEQNPPVIKAEEGPTKVRPASPGGMEVPNQGMKVYELGRPGATQAAAGGVERILPKAEEPMPRPKEPPPEPAATRVPDPALTTPAPPAAAPVQASGNAAPAAAALPTGPAPSAPAIAGAGTLPQTPTAPAQPPVAPAAGLSTSAPATAGIVAPPPPPLPGSGQPMPSITEAPSGAVAARAGGPAAPAAPPPAPPPREDSAVAAVPPRGITLGGRAPATALPPIGSPAPQDTPAPAARPAAQQATLPAAAKTQAAATDGSHRVQLVAAKSDAEAQVAWQAAVKRHGDLLGSLRMETQTIEIAGKGTFVRVLVGPLGSKEDAQKLCDALKARKQDCLVR